MFTASVSLTRAWLTDAFAPTQWPLACGTRTTTEQSDQLDGEFRLLAGGRIQLVVRDADTTVRPIQFAALTASQAKQVKDWRGRLLLLRTVDGERIYGGYLLSQQRSHYNVSVDAGLTRTAFDVTVTFTEVDFDERV